MLFFPRYLVVANQRFFVCSICHSLIRKVSFKTYEFCFNESAATDIPCCEFRISSTCAIGHRCILKIYRVWLHICCRTFIDSERLTSPQVISRNTSETLGCWGFIPPHDGVYSVIYRLSGSVLQLPHGPLPSAFVELIMPSTKKYLRFARFVQPLRLQKKTTVS